ncbi:hypothetical protein BH09ACT9_BH09ACT9_33840 [soil metagenome]
MVSTPEVRPMPKSAALTTSVAISSDVATAKLREGVSGRGRLRAATAALFRRSRPRTTFAPPLSVLLLVTSDNGLSQRAGLVLREAGHQVRTAVVADADAVLAATSSGDFDLVICPFLKAYVPESVWQRWTTIIIPPGPP